MGVSLSFEGYVNALNTVPKIKRDYRCFKEFDNKKKEVLALYNQYLADLQNADNCLKKLKREINDAYNNVIKLTSYKFDEENFNITEITSISEFERAIAYFNDFVSKIEKSGGTEIRYIEDFCVTYKKISIFLIKCETNQFSVESYKKDLERGRDDALSEVEAELKAAHKNLRVLLGIPKEAIRMHQNFLNEKSIFDEGFRFPETLDSGIKLGRASVEVTNEEATIIHDVYPEIECENGCMKVPYVFPISCDENSHKSNIYIEFDDSDEDTCEQISIAVHQMILKIISKCPVGDLILHCADTSENANGDFVYISANFKRAIKNIKDPDIANALVANLCELATDDILSQTKKEFKAVKENQYKMIEGVDLDQHLYVYFALSYNMGSEACKQLRQAFELDRGCGALGVHNLIVVSKSDILAAEKIIAKGNVGSRELECAKAFLDTLEVIKENSDCFEHLGECDFALSQAKSSRKVSVQIGDKYFPRPQAFKATERTLIDTVEQCNVEVGTPFIDLVGEKAFEREKDGEFLLGEYADKKGTLTLNGNENIAVIFLSDNSFSPDEKSRIMSSLMLATLTARKPGQKRLCFMSQQHNTHILNVVNGLESDFDGVKYSLFENYKELSTQEKIEEWRESIRNISKILTEKKHNSGNKNYSISDLMAEDSSKYMRVIYDEYSDDGYSYDDIRGTLIRDVVSFSHQTNGGVQCVLEINTDEPQSWVQSFVESGAFDHIIIAKNHSFFDQNNRRIKLSVLAYSDEAQIISTDILKAYVKHSVTSPTYEKIGFGSKVATKDITSSIKIPVGLRDGSVLTMDFNSSGGGATGYMVQGTTNTGKSCLLFSLIYNGAMKYAPDALQFYLLDFKEGISFNDFRTAYNPIPHVKQLSIKNDTEDADAILRNINDEITRRSVLFKKYGNGIDEISKYNALVANGKADEKEFLPRLIVIMDECQNAFYTLDSTGSNSENSVLVERFEAMTRVGRAYGVHFVLATQSMSGSLAKKIGGQLAGRCSFKMGSADSASALLSYKVAQKVDNLPPRGVMLFSTDSGNSCTSVQVAFDYGKRSEYSEKIRNQYANSKITTFEIGNEQPLKISANELERGRYISAETASICLPFAQNCMSGENIQIAFEQKENQSLLMIGQNSNLASKIMASLMYNAARLSPNPAKTVLYTSHSNSQSVSMVRTILGEKAKIVTEVDDILKEIYLEIQKRDEQLRNAAVGVNVKVQPWVIVFDGLRNEFFDDTSISFANVIKAKADVKAAEPAEPARSSFMKTTSIGGGRYSTQLTTPAATASSNSSINIPSDMSRSEIWAHIAQRANELGIYVCVYLSNPSMITSAKRYFDSYKHLIVFPSKSVTDCIDSLNGISIPMRTSLGNKHVAFQSKLSDKASVCYYVTDSEMVSSKNNLLEDNNDDENVGLSGGVKVYKIKPYMIQSDN